MAHSATSIDRTSASHVVDLSLGRYFGMTSTKAFWLIFAATLASRMLSWRVAIYDTAEARQVMNPGVADPALAWPWITTFHDALIRGLSHDVIFSVFAAIVLGTIGTLPRRISLGLLAMFLSANVEHIKYNFAHIDPSSLGMATSMTFVRGSLTPDVLKYLVVIVAAMVLVALMLRMPAFLKATRFLTPGLVLISLPYLFLPSPSAPAWMQSNALAPTIYEGRLVEDSSKPDPISVMWRPPPVAAPGTYNLLLVYMEGLSQSSLERGDMQNLKALGRQGIWFENYVSRQIITANGLYATLTGDTPSFLRHMPKWNELDREDLPVDQALPRILARQGYHTGFLQAADLTYMAKESRMEMLGFADIKGNADWTAAHSRSGWGVDDLTLVEGTLSYLDQLQSDTPWFVSILTSGTHSPYNVPGNPAANRNDALQAADAAIGTLMDGLRAGGYLENTVVVITSDEGREITGENNFLNDLTLNRLPLIVLHPDLKGVSVSDYLLNTDFRDLARQLTQPLDAQILLSHLPAHEDMVFGNIITGKVFWYAIAEQTLTACNLRGLKCQKWPNRAELFTPSPADDTWVSMPAFANLLNEQDLETAAFTIPER